MTEKLIKHRAPLEAATKPPTRLVEAPTRRELHPERLAMVVGPAVGFVLAAMLAISFALALAGGAGAAAVGSSDGLLSPRSAVFVL